MHEQYNMIYKLFFLYVTHLDLLLIINNWSFHRRVQQHMQHTKNGFGVLGGVELSKQQRGEKPVPFERLLSA